jgi:hypothetical protein
VARTIGFSTDDTGRVRFGVSCMWEVLTSLRVLRESTQNAVHLWWTRRTMPVVRREVPDLGLLADLVGSGVRGDYAPDFLTPLPGSLDPRWTPSWTCSGTHRPMSCATS